MRRMQGLCDFDTAAPPYTSIRHVRLTRIQSRRGAVSVKLEVRAFVYTGILQIQ
jgi:hypothetical protein